MQHCCAENSEARLGKDVQYKLLVRALHEQSNEELTQLVSQSFSVSSIALVYDIYLPLCLSIVRSRLVLSEVMSTLFTAAKAGCLTCHHVSLLHSRKSQP